MQDLEQIILTNLQRNEEYARKVIPHLKEEYFEDKINKLYFSMLQTHFLTYNTFPTVSATKVEIQGMTVDEQTFKNLIKRAISIFENKIEKEIDWLVDKTEEFCKNRALYLALLESVNIAQSTDENSSITKTTIPDLLNTALAVSFDTNIGHDYVGDVDGRFESYKEKKHKIKFHIDSLNVMTGGGIERKTVNCILSPTGGGKTMFMCDLAANWMKQGYNVLYITNEMAEKSIALRIDANLMNTEIGKVKLMDRRAWDQKVENLKVEIKGKLKIKEYPTSTAHVGHFRFLLKELKQKQKFIPDIVIIDYLNICASAKHKNKSDSYGYVKSITEEIRGFASEQNVALFTATQTNRSGQNTTDFDITSVSESMGGPMTMDLLFGLVATEDLSKNNQALIIQLKNRYGDVFKNKSFMIGVDRSKMRFYQTDNDDVYGNSPTVKETTNYLPTPNIKKQGNFSGIKS